MPKLRGARAVFDFFRRHPRLVRLAEVGVAVAVVALCVYGVRGVWSEAGPHLANARISDVGFALLSVAGYYLVFVVGWMRILETSGIRVSYRVALQAEMASMLAKYVPGGVWTPAARVAALQRLSGETATGTVLVSIFVEAILSALAGVVVFVVSLAWVRDVHAPLAALLLFAVGCVALLHPRVFGPLLRRVLRPFHLTPSEPLALETMSLLLAFYCATWILAGFGLYFLIRSVGAPASLDTIPFLGGTAAIGAIVAVLAVFSPSGLGAREASMYGLLIAVTTRSNALSATILNRLTITVVELGLFFAGLALWRLTAPKGASRPARPQAALPAAEPSLASSADFSSVPSGECLLPPP